MYAPEIFPGGRHSPGQQVTIIGAGPSGLACAIVLARAGRRVIVREWHRCVGARFHGDFQGLENWSDEQDVLDELHSAGIETNFEHSPVLEGAAYDSRNRQYRMSSRRPLYYLVRRGKEVGCLDHDLLGQATALGVEVRFDDRAREAEGVSVLAAGPRTADAIAVGYVFDTDMADGGWLALDNRLAPLGYAYLLIHGGRGTVASCMFSGFKKQAEHVARTVNFFRERVGLAMRNERSFGGFANFGLPRTATQDGHPVIGEQAGFQDALAGFGMRYAIKSGLLAARSIVHGLDYAALWRRELLPLLRVSIVNRYIYNVAGDWGWRLALRKLERRDSGLVLHRFYRPSMFSRIAFPIAQFRYRSALHDPTCDHVDCECVWCRCRTDAKTSPGSQTSLSF